MSLSLKFSIHGGEGFSSEDHLQLPEGDGAVFFFLLLLSALGITWNPQTVQWYSQNFIFLLPVHLQSN